MKTKKDLRKLDETKLKEELEENSKALTRIELEINNGHSKNTAEIKKHRKQIARIKTIRTEKQLNPVS